MVSQEHYSELPSITPVAANHGVDPYFILAIRCAENGKPGRDFGVLSVEAATYAEQCAVCCSTVAHRVATFAAMTDRPPIFEYDHGVVRYTEVFIRYFAGIWAPRGAENDPQHLNQNWADNVVRLYAEIRGHATA